MKQAFLLFLALFVLGFFLLPLPVTTFVDGGGGELGIGKKLVPFGGTTLLSDYHKNGSLYSKVADGEGPNSYFTTEQSNQLLNSPIYADEYPSSNKSIGEIVRGHLVYQIIEAGLVALLIATGMWMVRRKWSN